MCLSDKCGGQGPGACMSRPEADTQRHRAEQRLLWPMCAGACCCLPDLGQTPTAQAANQSLPLQDPRSWDFRTYRTHMTTAMHQGLHLHQHLPLHLTALCAHLVHIVLQQRRVQVLHALLQPAQLSGELTRAVHAGSIHAAAGGGSRWWCGGAAIGIHGNTQDRTAGQMGCKQRVQRFEVWGQV